MRSAIILVGGEARRANGKEKYFFVYQGKTFIERLVDTLTDVVDEIIIVARNQDQCKRFESLNHVTCVSDVRRGMGPVGGLHAGVHVAKGDQVFVSACDMPCIDSRVITYLFREIDSYDAVIPRWSESMFEPLHAVYKRSALLGYLESHTSLSLRTMIQSLNAKYISVEDLKKFDPDLKTFTNINMIEDLERISNSQETTGQPRHL